MLIRINLIFFTTGGIINEFLHVFLSSNQNGTRLGAIGGRYISLGLHTVNQFCGTAITDFQFALQQRGGNAFFLNGDTNGVCILAVRTLVATVLTGRGNKVTATAALVTALCGKFFELGNELFIILGSAVGSADEFANAFNLLVVNKCA